MQLHCASASYHHLELLACAMQIHCLMHAYLHMSLSATLVAEYRNLHLHLLWTHMNMGWTSKKGLSSGCLRKSSFMKDCVTCQ